LVYVPAACTRLVRDFLQPENIFAKNTGLRIVKKEDYGKAEPNQVYQTPERSRAYAKSEGENGKAARPKE